MYAIMLNGYIAADTNTRKKEIKIAEYIQNLLKHGINSDMDVVVIIMYHIHFAHEIWTSHTRSLIQQSSHEFMAKV